MRLTMMRVDRDDRARVRSAWIALGWIAGCTCGAPASTEPARIAIEIVEAPVAAPPSSPLPATARTDLPAVTPRVVVTVDAESYEVSNRALVDSWPTAEVAALAAAHGGPTWLVVEQRVALTTGDLVVPGVQRAFAAARTVELARAAHATTLAFSVRAGPDVHFSRVLSAVYAAGTNGYADPVLVLASPRGEVGLALRPGSARPEALGAPQADEIVDPSDEDLARVDEILQEAQAGRAPPPAPLPEVPAGVTGVCLLDHGLRVRRGAVALGPGCTGEQTSDASLPIARDAITPAAVSACLAAIGDPGTFDFGTPSDTRYADAVAVIEALAAHGAVTLRSECW